MQIAGINRVPMKTSRSHIDAAARSIYNTIGSRYIIAVLSDASGRELDLGMRIHTVLTNGGMLSSLTCQFSSGVQYSTCTAQLLKVINLSRTTTTHRIASFRSIAVVLSPSLRRPFIIGTNYILSESLGQLAKKEVFHWIETKKAMDDGGRVIQRKLSVLQCPFICDVQFSGMRIYFYFYFSTITITITIHSVLT